MAVGKDLVFSICENAVDPSMWSALDGLWARSAEQSPFQSPAVLRHHYGFIDERIVVFTCQREGSMIGAVVLKLNTDGRLSFLSDLKTDVNHFLFDGSIMEGDKEVFFRGILATVKERNWAWTLNNQPAWVGDVGMLQRIAKEEGLYCSSIEHSACPIIKAASPQELFDLVNGSRELRYRVNRLRKKDDAEFEVLTDGSMLEEWVSEFCDAHVLRWADTPTPSHLQDPIRREFLSGCLKAWAEAGLLVRFAIRVGAKRIGFVVGLRATDTLIHHSTTYHPEHARSSPGKALIHFMAQWMEGNGYCILDFGDGQEEYKYTVANGEKKLKRVFISTRMNIAFILSVELIKRVKNAPLLYSFYQRHIKQRLKS